MKSAYQVLGIPGNAVNEDIEIAFQRAKLAFSPTRLAESPDAIDRFKQIEQSYQLLMNSETRAAHDRKLVRATAPAPVVYVEKEEGMSGTAKFGLIAISMVAIVFVFGYHSNTKRAEAEKQKAAIELALKKQEAEQAEKLKLEEQKEAAAKAALQAKAEAQERQFRNNASIMNFHQANLNARNDANAAARAAYEGRIEAEDKRRDDELRRRAELDQRLKTQQENQLAAQRRAEDAARIRSLCMTNYGRPNC